MKYNILIIRMINKRIKYIQKTLFTYISSELGKMVLKMYLKCKMQNIFAKPFKMQNRKWFLIFYLKWKMYIWKEVSTKCKMDFK